MTLNKKKVGRSGSLWLSLCVIALATFTCLLSSAQEIPGWELVWQDEFDGPNIDMTKWSHEEDGWGGGNNELQYYTARSQNSFIENGNLVIQALEETYTGPDGTRDYTSARLRTLNKGDWTYGRFEARMKLPYGQGLWPAFWMLPTDWVYGGWAASGEIDIMEIVGHEPNVLHGTIHYGGEWPNNTYSGGSYTLPSGDFSDDFHVFAIEWEEGEIRWYVDGIHYSTKNAWHSDAGPYPAPFNQRFHFLLNVAVGGQWPGNPDGSTVFPQRMEVDYVRVYSSTNAPPPPSPSTPYTGTPMAIPGTIEAEDYDNGGPGVAYIDADGGNNGNSYRSDGVDIEACTDSGGGYNVGWAEDGEWLKYTVDIASAGDYTITTRVASQDGGGAFHIEVDDVDVTGSIPVGATGGWQDWVDKSASVSLGSGEQVVKLVIESGGMNINRMEFVLDQAVNAPPFFTSYPIISKPNAVEEAAYSDTIAGDATDPDSDPMTFSKVSGPAWLSVATNGVLSGTPGDADVGLNSWSVQVSDGINSPGSATLEITVVGINYAPVFTNDPIVMPNALEGSGYIKTIAGSATDADPGDTLLYSSVSGPAWLNVATNGMISGLPGSTDVGLNSWTVQVTDGIAAPVSATLEITVESTSPPPPALSILASGPNLEIMWPSSTTGFSLYSSTNLIPPVVWLSVTNTPIIQGDDWMVVMPLVGAPQFFQLQSP